MNRKLLVGAVSAALALPMAAQGVEFSVSGQVNRAIMVMDDGVDTDVQHQEGTASGSRFRFKGSQDLGNGMTAGVNMEVGLDGAGSSPTGAMDNQATKGPYNGNEADGSGASDPIRLRQVNAYFSGAFGKVTLGQQSHANDLTQYATKDNYGWLGGIEAGCDFGCGLMHRNRADGKLSNVRVDNGIIYSSFRDDLLRYDTPALGPAKVSVSAGNNDYQDVSLEVGGDMGGFSYQLVAGADSRDKVEVSGAVGFAQGTNFSVAWARLEDMPGQEPRLWHAQVGHNLNNTSVSLIYQSSDDVYMGGQDGTSWGIGVGHAFPDAGVEIYASFRTWEADIPGMDLEDMNIFVVGSRIKFN